MALQYSLILKRNKTYEDILQFIILQDDTTNGDAHLLLTSAKTYEAILQLIIHQDDTTMAMPTFCQTTIGGWRYVPVLQFFTTESKCTDSSVASGPILAHT